MTSSKGIVEAPLLSVGTYDVVVQKSGFSPVKQTGILVTLGQLQVGDRVNLETDLLAKYVQRQLAQWQRPARLAGALFEPGQGFGDQRVIVGHRVLKQPPLRPLPLERDHLGFHRLAHQSISALRIVRPEKVCNFSRACASAHFSYK
jgi:hypothetical protein